MSNQRHWRYVEKHERGCVFRWESDREHQCFVEYGCSLTEDHARWEQIVKAVMANVREHHRYTINVQHGEIALDHA